MKYILRFLPFIFVFYLAAVEVNDSRMIDKLAKYVKVPKSALNDLYSRTSIVKSDGKVRLSFDRPIFTFFPGLTSKLPHITLGNLPTSIKKLQKLGKQIGCENLYVKRDDNTGEKTVGSKSRFFGGNKIRKLEFLLAEALCSGCKTVMTIGGAGSNHALATAVCASKLGLKRVSILGPQENNNVVRRNLLLGKFYGADLHYFKHWKNCSSGIVDLFFQIKKTDGVFPYYITLGGSSPLGVVGFVDAAFELKMQIQKGVMPEPDFIYVACGSMGTTAGLLLGLKAAGLKSKIVAIRVGDSTRKSKIIDLFKEANLFLKQKDSKFPMFDIKKDEILFKKGFLGKGYAHPTKKASEAINLMKEYGDVNLDPTYSGKAFAAVIDHARKKLLQDKVVLFWDTFCGYEYNEIVSRVDYKTLPTNLHTYFN